MFFILITNVNNINIFYNKIVNHNFYLLYFNHYKIFIFNRSKINFNVPFNFYFYNLHVMLPLVAYYYYKILIKSKIYRIFSNKKKTHLFPHINYFHIIRIFIFFTKVINFKKKLILFGLSKSKLFKTLNNLLFFKKINIFTQRGFKISRHISYKKVGKIAKYF